jgi:hypothetical protein
MNQGAVCVMLACLSKWKPCALAASVYAYFLQEMLREMGQGKKNPFIIDLVGSISVRKVIYMFTTHIFFDISYSHRRLSYSNTNKDVPHTCNIGITVMF